MVATVFEEQEQHGRGSLGHYGPAGGEHSRHNVNCGTFCTFSKGLSLHVRFNKQY